MSEAFDAEYLQKISVVVCPVSGVALTQGAQQESDWSIDRLDNELGYVPGNICVLSSRANELKSTDGIKELALDTLKLLREDGLRGLVEVTETGLTGLEALRLAALIAGPSGASNGMVYSFPPAAMAPDVIGTVEAAIAGIHVGCARTRIEGRAYRRRVAMFKNIGRDTWRGSNRFVDLIRAKISAGVHPCDLWFEGDLVERLCELREALFANPPNLAPNVESDALKQVFGGIAGFSKFTRVRN